MADKRKVKVAIIGAGLTGLSAADAISGEYIILEKESRVGGLSKTFFSNGFSFDFTGHFLHFKDPQIKSWILSLFPEGSLKEVERKAYIYIQKSFVPYPFQSHLYYLPEDSRKECLEGFLKTIKEEFDDKNEKSFVKWVDKTFGEGVGKYFMYPYNRKLWAINPDELTVEWLGEYVPRPEKEVIIKGATEPTEIGPGYNAVFYYPEKGIGVLADKMAENIDSIELNTRVTKIEHKKKVLYTENSQIEYNYLINTAPLKNLMELIDDIDDEAVLSASSKLKCNQVLNINLGWDGPVGSSVPEGTHWIYFPEENVEFYRIGFPSVVSDKTAPSGKNSCYIEISYKEGELPKEEDWNKIADKAISDLKQLDIIPESSEIIEKVLLQIDSAYVTYDNNWNINRKTVLDYLSSINIISGGRYGGWEYSAMEDAIIWGRALAAQCQ